MTHTNKKKAFKKRKKAVSLLIVRLPFIYLSFSRSAVLISTSRSSADIFRVNPYNFWTSGDADKKLDQERIKKWDNNIV